MNRHHAHQVFAFALEFCGGDLSFGCFHIFYIAYEIKQPFPAPFLILFRFFQQEPQVCLAECPSRRYAEIIIVAGFTVKHPQKFRQRKVARGLAPAF